MGVYDELPSVFRKDKQAEANQETKQLAEQAALALADLVEDYPKWTMSEIHQMFSLLDQALSVSGEERFLLIREAFFRKAHDIKGQGTTFGYPLMTEIGSVICDYLRNKTAFSDHDLALMRTCVQDLSFVLDNHLMGDGGDKALPVRERLAFVKGDEQ